MTLLCLLLILGWERAFKMGEHWQLDHLLTAVFRQQRRVSLARTLLMCFIAMALTATGLLLIKGKGFGVPQLFVGLVVGLLCIGAGSVRLHYHAYLNAASRGDADAHQAMAEELTLIHGLPDKCSEREYLCALQNALLWINYRFYLAPLFWFIVGGVWGPALLAGYAVLRAWQTWLARHRSPLERTNAGIDLILHCLDWLPVRLVGVAYALLGHGEKALPAWFASLGDRSTAQYRVLTQLAQYSLARDLHTDKVETPRIAVAMAKKVSLAVVTVVALLTIYGTLV